MHIIGWIFFVLVRKGGFFVYEAQPVWLRDIICIVWEVEYFLFDEDKGLEM